MINLKLHACLPKIPFKLIKQLGEGEYYNSALISYKFYQDEFVLSFYFGLLLKIRFYK